MGESREVPDPDKGTQEGFLEEGTSGSLIQFGGELEVWPGIGACSGTWGWGVCDCVVEGEVSETWGQAEGPYSLKSLDLGSRDPQKWQDQVCVLRVWLSGWT